MLLTSIRGNISRIKGTAEKYGRGALDSKARSRMSRALVPVMFNDADCGGWGAASTGGDICKLAAWLTSSTEG